MTSVDIDYQKTLKNYCSLIETELDRRLPCDAGEVGDAMRYSLMAGGKRIRPIMVLEFCRVNGGDIRAALPFAAAIEMIHTYSLIHDDLPCMDDDDLRRGRPSCHKRFAEATALLAGDGLLTYAFGLLSSAPLPADRVVRAVACLSEAAGFAGMIGGQMLDLANEGRQVDAVRLDETNLKKTGALITAACKLGCIAAGANGERLAAAETYARNVGLAFQITDDILDVKSTAEELGKPVGSDAKNEKSTYVSVYGMAFASETAAGYTRDAVDALSAYGSEAHFLRETARRLILR